MTLQEINYVELAKLAYHAYGGVTDWKNYQGLPMPEWDNLPPKIQEAWQASVKEVWLLARGGRVMGSPVVRQSSPDKL